MTIFLLLFAIAVAYVFMWSQNSGVYIDTVRRQVDYERSRLTENLIVTAKNLTTIVVENPTAQVIVVTQIWSNNSMVWGPGQQGISPFGSFEFVGNTGWVGDGNFTVVTFRGNIFSGGLQTQIESSTRRSWEVTWYWNDSITPDIHTAEFFPRNMSSNLALGKTYWYDLNLDYEWNYLNNPVIAQAYNMTDGTMLGFIAKTTLIKLTDSSSDAWINFYVSNTSRIAISTNASVPFNWQTGPIRITGGLYSLHEITVYFDGYGRGDAKVRLNIVNATFAR